MSYVLLDDNFCFHPKVLAAGNDAIGVLVRCWAYSASLGTGGHIPWDVINHVAGSPQKGSRVRSRLVEARLLESCETHPRCAQVHDWQDLNDTEAEAAERRAAQAAKKRRQRARKRGVTGADYAGQGFLSPLDTEGDNLGDTDGDIRGDNQGDTGGHVPPQEGGLSRAHPRPPSPTPSVSTQLVDPPPSRNAREKDPGTYPAIAQARRRATASADPDLTEWGAETLNRIRFEACTRYRVGGDEAWDRLLALAALPDTRGPGRLLDPVGWDVAGREVNRMAADHARRRVEDQAQAEQRRHAATVDAEQEKRRTKVAQLLDSDPDGWQAATTAAADALTAAGITPLGPLIEARALSLYQPQETSR